jgi:4-carboxymuconolactone decarboxylase
VLNGQVERRTNAGSCGPRVTTEPASDGERLPRLSPHHLDADQRAVRDAILGGPRQAAQQPFPLVADDGSLNGPFGLMVHTPSVGGALQELGSAIRYRTALPARVREIAILQVAAVARSTFEWWAHERVGRAAGLTHAELQCLAEGRALELDDPVEQAAHRFVTAVLHDPALSSAEFVEAEQVLGSVALVELTVLVGYYRLLADAMAVFAIGVPES